MPTQDVLIPCSVTDGTVDPDPQCNIVGAQVFQVTESGIRWLWTSQDLNGNAVVTTGTLCYRELGSTTWINLPGGTSSSFNVVQLNLTPETTYEWQAKSTLPDGSQCVSSINQITTLSDGTQPQEDCTIKANSQYAAWEVETVAAYGGWIPNGGPNQNGVSGDSFEWKGGDNFFLTEAGEDILKYTVCIVDPGVYQFKIRSYADNTNTAVDKSNDIWVRFPTGVDVAGQVTALQDWIKVFRGGFYANQWTWVSSAEKNSTQWQTTQQFFSAGNHCIELSGRSNCHSIDRIVLCKVGTVPNPDAVPNSPLINCDENPAKQLPSGSLYDPNCEDIVALHYDVAPDLDDLQALAAGCSLSRCFNIDPCVVIGTYGLLNGSGNHQAQYLTDTNLLGQSNPTYQGQTRQQLANAVATAAFGAGNYLDTGDGWNGAVNAQAAKWKAALNSGCDVWVAEGGPMDFTSDVLRRLVVLGCTQSQLLQKVHVIQHANFNVTQTLAVNFNYVQNNSDYVLIPNGNNPNNGSADLENAAVNTTNSSFAQWARNSACAGAWNAALDRFSSKVDFSDTVEYLHILGIGTGAINNLNDFCDYVD